MGQDEEDELSKFDNFWDDEDDTIKPIDLQGDPLLATPKFDDDEETGKDKKDATVAPPSNPAPAPDLGEASAQGNPNTPPNLDDIMGEKNNDGDKEKDSARLAEERFLRDMDEQEGREKSFLEISDRTYVNKGDYFDMFARDPALRDIHIGAGWDQRSFENAPIDVDLSLFLLNKDDMTREDGDFVFYNNMTACEGAVKLMEDSRTGAGDGDDERMLINLQGLPFDILKIRFVLSVYDEKLEGFSFDNVRNVYFRMANQIDGTELFCFELQPEDIAGARAIEVGTLVREGPKWYFSAEAKVVEGGHAAVAKEYGMLIAEDTG